MAINEALRFVENDSATRAVPLALRNAPTSMMKKMGYSSGYQYSHNGDGNFVYQEFMPEGLEGKKFYEPQNSGSEAKIADTVLRLWKGKY